MKDRQYEIGMTAYGTDQGLGYLAKSFYDAGVSSEILLVHHGKRKTHPEWYNNQAVDITKMPIKGKEVGKVLQAIDIMLFFETPFDWNLPNLCTKYGVKTVMMPMYEWYPKDKLGVFDLMLCPSRLDQDYFPGSPLFQPPVDPSTWSLKTEARRFVHNAGNVGHRQHKGTLELLHAVKYIESDLTLTIRAQDVPYFNTLLAKVPGIVENPRVNLELSTVPHEDLYRSHDVAVVPEKFNGLSLPLQEAYAAGLLVMTTNRYPANTWLPTQPMIPVESTHKAKIGGGYLEFDECVLDPRTIAATMDEWYGKEITGYSLEALRWARLHSWELQKPKLMEILEGVL